MHLNIAQWNSEGLQKKKPELQKFLHDNKIDVICIQETMTKDNQKIFIRGFEAFRRDRKDRHKGGIITFVRNTIPAVEVQHFDTEELEHQTVKLLLPGGDMHVTNCYSPPSTPLGLHHVNIHSTRHLVVGDFNSHSPSWGYATMDARGEDLEDWMMEKQLTLINQPDDKPTCYSRAWKTLSTPDVAMATDDIHRITTRTVQTQLGGSDHLPVILNISTEGCRTHSMRPSWNLKRANWEHFSHKTDTLTNAVEESADLNKNVKLFTTAILQAAKETIPRGKRKDYIPHWSKEVDTLHTKLSKARETMEQNPTPENTQAHNQLKEAFNQLKTKETRNTWQEKTANLNMETDSRKLWNLVSTLNEEKKREHIQTVLEENGTHYAGRQAANILADSYQEESRNTIPQQRIRDVKQEKKELLRNENTNPTMMSPLTEMELNAAIAKLKTKKAPGKDGILSDMLKHLGPRATQKLLLILNQSWTTGKCPDSWREAVIVPVLKKQKDKTKKTSYRPISLLSCLGKLMERIVNARLLKHLEENNLLNNTQSAFRKNRSTEDQLVFLAQEIENAYQKRKKTLAVFIDLTKAFDKVWRDGLLLKLLRKHVGGRMFSWIQDFLQHRTARVRLDGHTSHRVRLQQGVPQGGVISTTLFIVFIDDITDRLSRHISKALHADDLAIWNAEEHLTTATYRIQEALNIVAAWAKDWGVVINETKTVASIFSLSTQPEQAKLQLNGKHITLDDTPTYLGVRLDRRLTWNPQAQSMESKASRRLALMKKLAGTTWGAHSNILRRVYTGAVRPILEYGSTAWATAAKTNTARLNKIQNAGLRLITGAMKSTPIQTMESHCNLRPLDNRRDEKILVHREKLTRLTDHPMHQKLQEPTANRLKRLSFNHLSKSLSTRHENPLPTDPEEIEPLHAFENPMSQPEGASLVLSVPGVGRKEDHSPHELKSLALEMIEANYHPAEWTHAFSDGSSEGAVKNGGAGVFIKYTDGNSTSKALPTGKISSNFRAEAAALLCATSLLLNAEPTPPKIVFFTDCRSLLQSLQKPSTEKQLADIQENIRQLSRRSTVFLQWLPSHCGISGNEKADELSKTGSSMKQPTHRVTYREAKTILRNKFQSTWQANTHTPPTREDPIHNLPRKQQTILFRLRTGHCRLLSHLHRLRVSHTDACPCGTGPQTPDHILQLCPTFQTLRTETWPTGSTLQQKLWGSLPDLQMTAAFIEKTELLV
nr:hypothetical protein BaRGS_013693 [Batillaria attramentaria]